ncbi:hypothetical protein [Xenorhabdus lircayensis]|uniref:Uncharacterized protein n=1 Tax=Xenorhabdus lircayensis TaxID=2763499 RepID=A0ABS0U963_9GAMM|nr:hypothetical protein [Xenorhabdus lircayensis]MBI6550421.1 hypothetical protein [Xenorhabdus lircayensis]
MRLIWVSSDYYVFEEPHRKVLGKNRLTIVCHGSDHRVGVPHVRLEGKLYNAAQFSQYIKRLTKINELYNIRLVSCGTATLDRDKGGLLRASVFFKDWSWSTAFGSQLSLFLPNIFVRAYMGSVTVDCVSEYTWGYYIKKGLQATEDMLTESFGLHKNTTGTHYHCVVFLNGRFYKQSYNTDASLEF